MPLCLRPWDDGTKQKFFHVYHSIFILASALACLVNYGEKKHVPLKKM